MSNRFNKIQKCVKCRFLESYNLDCFHFAVTDSPGAISSPIDIMLNMSYLVKPSLSVSQQNSNKSKNEDIGWH